MPESTDWRIEPVSRNVLVLRCDLATTDEPRPILLVGDAHWDNPHCDRDRLKADYDACWAQHVHHTEVFDTQIAYLNDKNYIRHRTQWHIRTPS